MKFEKEILVQGIPKYIPEQIADDCRDRMIEAVRDLLFRSGMKNIRISVGTDLDLDKPESLPPPGRT